MWKLDEIQENTEIQFNEIRIKIHEKHEKINKEIKMIKRTKQILELKNSMNEMKTAIEYQHQNRPNRRQNSELDRNFEIRCQRRKKKKE